MNQNARSPLPYALHCSQNTHLSQRAAPPPPKRTASLSRQRLILVLTQGRRFLRNGRSIECRPCSPLRVVAAFDLPLLVVWRGWWGKRWKQSFCGSGEGG